MKYMVVLLALFEVQEYFDLEARRIGLSTEGSNAMGDPLESEVFLVRCCKRRLERFPPERTTKRNRRHEVGTPWHEVCSAKHTLMDSHTRGPRSPAS